MAKLNNISTLVQSVKTVPELARFMASAFDALIAQFNGKVDFGDNIRTSGPIAVAFNTATNPQNIKHGLGRQPIGFFVTNADGVGWIYHPDSTLFPWDSTQIWLTSSTNVNASILVF